MRHIWLVILFMVSSVAPAAATGTGSPDLQVMTTSGCGTGVLIPSGDRSLPVVVRATNLPTAATFPVELSLIDSSGARFTQATTLSSAVPERTVPLEFGPFPQGLIVIEAVMPGLELMAACTVMATDIPPTTQTPGLTPTPTATRSATATASPSVTPRIGAGDANCDGASSAADLSRQVALIATDERAPCGLDDADGDGELTAGDIDALIGLLFAA